MTGINGEMDRLRAHLAELATASAKSARADVQIGEAAHQRHAAVSAELAELRPKVLTDAGAGERYQAFVQERGQLDRVIGRRQRP